MLLGSPSKVDLTIGGKRIARGHRLWPVGGDVAKSELYGFLRLTLGEGGEAPAGYCHFPEYGEWYFKQLTSEHLVTIVNRKTRQTRREWHVLPNRENHILDARSTRARRGTTPH
jgi:phage terminase large subunit GpA-like protein